MYFCNLWIFEHLLYSPQVPIDPNINLGFFLSDHCHLIFLSERHPSWLGNIPRQKQTFLVCQLPIPNINEKFCEALSRGLQAVH